MLKFLFSVCLAWMGWLLPLSADPLVVGYYTNWSQYRPGVGACKPSHLASIAGYLTDLNYAFLFFNYQSAEQPAGPTQDWKVHFSEWNDLSLLKEIVAFKTSHPSLRINVSIGGWGFNDPHSKYGPTTLHFFSEMVADPQKYQAFIESALDLCQTHHLDGIDLDWEFPGVVSRGGSSEDYQNFAHFVIAFRHAIEAKGSSIRLTAAVPPQAPSGFVSGSCKIGSKTYKIQSKNSQSYIDWLSALSTYFDGFNVMCYNYGGPWMTPMGENAPLFPLIARARCVESSVAGYLKGNTPPSKIVVGIPAFANTFSGVAFPSKLPHQPQGPNCSFKGPGPAGPYTEQAGMLSYYEVMGNLESTALDGMRINPVTKTAYTWNTKARTWASFDSSSTAFIKAKWIASQKLGGAMIYTLDLDNFMDPIAPFAITSSALQGLGIEKK